jgi:hypothetical protein
MVTTDSLLVVLNQMREVNDHEFGMLLTFATAYFITLVAIEFIEMIRGSK